MRTCGVSSKQRNASMLELKVLLDINSVICLREVTKHGLAVIDFLYCYLSGVSTTKSNTTS